MKYRKITITQEELKQKYPLWFDAYQIIKGLDVSIEVRDKVIRPILDVVKNPQQEGKTEIIVALLDEEMLRQSESKGLNINPVWLETVREIIDF